MVLSGHINTLYTKLAHLDKQVQIYCIYPHPQSEVIQLNAPDYDPDIDGDAEPVTDVQSPNAKFGKEDTSTGTPKSEDHTTISPITNRPEHQPSEVLPDLRRLLIPIYDLQNKSKNFKWTEEVEKAFNDIKKLNW